MKAFRFVLALATLLAATACSSDVTGPGTANGMEKTPVIGSPG